MNALRRGAIRVPPPVSAQSAAALQQLAERSLALNALRTDPEGEFVLYWMQSTHRLDDNWALRLAAQEADRLGLPMLIHQGLDPTYPYASDRVHTFVLEGARETARAARRRGLHYRFSLRRRRDDDRRVVDRLAARAALVVTDHYPTAGVHERSRRFAQRARCRVVAVDSAGVVPVSAFPRAEYGAFTIRRKLLHALEHYLQPVEDVAPRREPSPSLLRSLEDDGLDLERMDIAAEVARCEIDHGVPPVALRAGSDAARARLDAFLRDGLRRYHERRREPADEDGSSRLSRWLHFGMISPAEVVRAVVTHASGDALASFLDEMVVWRELALNHCWRATRPASLGTLPSWARATMASHERDRRPALYDRPTLERAASGDDLWNAAQRELLATGTMHNAVRQLWGKSVIPWSPTYRAALARLLYLNDRWALDGRDPNSVANILWCFGKFDRPFPERPIWGKIRPMSLERARHKMDTRAYIARWSR